jgi:hypothetical protein
MDTTVEMGLTNFATEDGELRVELGLASSAAESAAYLALRMVTFVASPEHIAEQSSELEHILKTLATSAGMVGENQPDVGQVRRRLMAGDALKLPTSFNALSNGAPSFRRKPHCVRPLSKQAAKQSFWYFSRAEISFIPNKLCFAHSSALRSSDLGSENPSIRQSCIETRKRRRFVP